LEKARTAWYGTFVRDDEFRSTLEGAAWYWATFRHQFTTMDDEIHWLRRDIVGKARQVEAMLERARSVAALMEHERPTIVDGTALIERFDGAHNLYREAQSLTRMLQEII
jgi:hypothetical protein